MLEHLKEAALHLKEATKMAGDWRVRDIAAGAGTAAECAIHIQQKIVWGKARMESKPPFERGEGAWSVREADPSTFSADSRRRLRRKKL